VGRVGILVWEFIWNQHSTGANSTHLVQLPEHLRVHVDDLHEVLVSSIRAEANVGVVIVGTFAVDVAVVIDVAVGCGAGVGAIFAISIARSDLRSHIVVDVEGIGRELNPPPCSKAKILREQLVVRCQQVVKHVQLPQRNDLIVNQPAVFNPR